MHMLYAPKQVDARPLSQETGHLYALYLNMKKLAAEMRDVCRMMERTEPWLDSKHRGDAHTRRRKS